MPSTAFRARVRFNVCVRVFLVVAIPFNRALKPQFYSFLCLFILVLCFFACAFALTSHHIICAYIYYPCPADEALNNKKLYRWSVARITSLSLFLSIGVCYSCASLAGWSFCIGL